jgi:hypothetical protein
MVSFFQAIRQKSSNHIATKVKKHLSIKHLRLQGNNKNKIEEFKDNMNIDVLRIANNSLSMIDIIPSDQEDNDEDFIDENYDMALTKLKLIAMFEQKGLLIHLMSTAGGGKPQSCAMTSIKRLVDYLLWMYELINKRGLSSTETDDIFDQWYIILQDHVGKIVEYCCHLEKNRDLAPQTIKNTLYDIKGCSFWYLMIYQKTQNGGDIWSSLQFFITKCCKKENRRDRQMKSSGKSIETVIADRRWPVNGLKELQKSCDEEIVKYIHINSATVIDEQYYNEFMKLIYATYYVFSIQGRIGAFSKLTYAQGEEMIITGNQYSFA